MNTLASNHAFLATGGAAGARIAGADWSAHRLGPPSGWDSALRTALNIVLSSAFPTFLAWGEELNLFYNDAYEPLLGHKRDALGRPLFEVWHEVWDSLGPYARRVLEGESFFFENHATTLERHGYPEKAYFTFSYSPLRDEGGAVRGLLCTVVEVTDKVAALARHKEAEERLAMSLEASGNIGTWSYDLEDGRTQVDERFARLFQIDAALARTGTELARFTAMIHPQDRARVVDAIAAAIRDETLYDIEYRIPQRSGQDVWVNARGKVFDDPATGRRRFAGIAVDITARKASEHALIETERLAQQASARAEESRRRLDALLDAAPVGIVYADPDGKLLAANAANRTIWGDHPLPDAASEYESWRGWWPQGGPGAGAPLGAHDWPLARVLAGADTAEATAEIEPFGMPGARKTILVRAQALRDEAGRLVGGVAANMDISAQVEAERALKASEQKFRNITNLMPQMVWSSAVDGSDQYVNQRWHEFTGIARLGPERNGWRALVHPDDLSAVLACWRTSFRDNLPFEVEHRLAHRGGGYRWVLSRALPFALADGQVTHWMGTMTDIHDQKANEAQLRDAARRKDEFLAMLAHELRNPLAPISSAAQLLAIAGADTARVRTSSDIIIRQVRHMTALVDDLLDVSRVTRGLVALHREPLAIETVVRGAVEQARPLIEARGHRLTLALDADGLRIDGDRTRLVQVLSNLLNNAAKYTPPGGEIVLTARRSVEAGGDRVVVEVSDNGIGIAADVLPQVFELFTQAERTPDRSQGGLGLGLALVRSLVQLHGGDVEAQSAGPGQGASFRVALPTTGAPAPAEPPLPLPVGAATDSLPATGARRVLIVDDNVDAAHALADVLRALGHEVASAASSHEALALAARDWPQVFVLDIGLPEIDGYELARRLRAQQGARATRFVALTGYGQASDRLLARDAGFDHHFVKPAEPGALGAVIASPLPPIPIPIHSTAAAPPPPTQHI